MTSSFATRPRMQATQRVDSSIHAQCFTSMSICEEGWCSLCASLDHVRTTCPFRPPVDYYHRPQSEGPRPPSDYLRPPADYPRSSADQARSRRPSPRPKTLSKRHFTSDEPCRKWNRYSYIDCRHLRICPCMLHLPGNRPWGVEVLKTSGQISLL